MPPSKKKKSFMSRPPATPKGGVGENVSLRLFSPLKYPTVNDIIDLERFGILKPSFNIMYRTQPQHLLLGVVKDFVSGQDLPPNA